MQQEKSEVLLVDDEEQVIRALRRALMDENYEICSAANGEEAWALFCQRPFKVVVCDERMPGMSGAELLTRVSNRFPETVRIMLTGQATLDAAMKAVNEGEIYRFFAKPWNDMEVRLSIRSAIEKHDLEQKNRKLLALARHQAQKLEFLELKHPGITDLSRSEDGRFLMEELSAEDVSSIFEECGVDRKP